MALSGICTKPGCGKPTRRRGLCSHHYLKAKATGPCAVEGCRQSPIAKGLCPTHYHRVRKYGSSLGKGTPHGAPYRFFESACFHDGVDCLIWPYGNASGYAMMSEGGKMRYVSRLVCEAVHGPAPSDSHEVAHSCGRGAKGCVSPSHLRWATTEENAFDKIAHGTHLWGENTRTAKLTEDDVRAIRSMRFKRTYEEIASDFGVSASNIGHIMRGDSWRLLKA